MDLGRFARTRFQLGMWLALPVALIVLVTVPSVLMERSAERALATHQALLNEMPILEKRVHQAETLLTATTPTVSQIGSAKEEATRRLDQAAKLSGLTIRALKVEESLVDAGRFQAVTITAYVQGTLPSLVQWLDEAQRPGLLLSVQAARLKALSLPPNEPFTADLSLLLFLRSSS